MPRLTDSPIPLPNDATNHVNNPESGREFTARHRSTTKSTPFDDGHGPTQSGRCARPRME